MQFVDPKGQTLSKFLIGYQYVETVVLLSNNFSKAKDYVEIGIDAEDYFRIKNSGKESK